ncbi:MAG TPA: hypothetical protein VNO14_14360 [Blastocatellia bacterium]|nr:hypothetical protein [Blastocatellia bacterium]
MRAKLVLLVLFVFLFAALASGDSGTSASAQEAMKKAEGAGQEQKPQPRRARSRGTRGVPKGVQNCVDRLIQIASADPLPAYGGQAEQIVNSGLLWNDPKSNCAIGEDTKLRLKVSEMANAWRMKDAAKVRSLLDEIKSAIPSS